MLLIASAFAAACSANAYIFNVAGTCDSNGIITGTSYEFSSLPEFGNPFDFSVAFFGNGDFQAYIFKGSAELDMSGSGGSVVFISNTVSYSGHFTVTNSIDNTVEVGSTGTYSATFDLNAGYYSFSIAGSPVPEPASMTALGLGALALIRRRRSSRS